MLRVFRKVIFFILMVASAQLMANTHLAVFKRHLNPILIETGSYMGDGIEMALQAGFKEVHSIELSPHLYQMCHHRFKDFPNVHLYLGDSGVVLKDVLEQVNERATFWLDGHYSAGITALGNTNTPILQELAIIATHPIKNHTILIDDVRQFGSVVFDFIEIDQIIEAIRNINPNYVIYFEEGFIANDVLVAKIP